MHQTATGSLRPQRSLIRRLLFPTWEQRKRLLAPQAWSVVIASYLAIIFALVCPQDFRSSHAGYIWIALAAFMIRTFLFHLGLFLSLITLVAGVARRWWLLGAAIPLVLFTVGPTLWSYRPRHAPVVAGETITVMSVNLLHANTTTGPIAAEIVAAQPDVLVLQEYTPRWHRAFQAALAVTYPHVSYVCRNDSFGQAIYARRPFGGPVNSDLPIGTVGLPEARAVIRLGERNVALYNVHLMPPKRHAWTIEQRWEFADLLEQLERERLPVILCGDFNFTNASAFADELERLSLIDAHRISGRGRGSTWPVLSFFRYLPGIRLDHIFISKELTSTSSRTGIGRESDHRPVIAEVGFAR